MASCTNFLSLPFQSRQGRALDREVAALPDGAIAIFNFAGRVYVIKGRAFNRADLAVTVRWADETVYLAFADGIDTRGGDIKLDLPPGIYDLVKVDPFGGEVQTNVVVKDGTSLIPRDGAAFVQIVYAFPAGQLSPEDLEEYIVPINVRADWSVEDPLSASYIQNKPQFITLDDYNNLFDPSSYASAADGALARSALQIGASADDLVEGLSRKLMTVSERGKLANLGISSPVDVNALASAVATGTKNYDTLALANADLASIAEGGGVNVLNDGTNNGFWVKEGGVLVKKSNASLSGMASEISAGRQGEASIAANMTAMKAVEAAANSKVSAAGLVVSRNGTSWKLSWSSATGMMSGNILSIAALATTTLAPTEGLYIDIVAGPPYVPTKAVFSTGIRADIAAGRKLSLIFSSSVGGLSGLLADSVRAAMDSKTTNSGKLYPLAQRTRNGVTSANQALAWRDALLDVRVEGSIDGELYQISFYENGVAGSPGEGWIIQAFNAATMASVNAPVTLVSRSNQQTPIVRGAGIQTIRIVPPARQDMAFVLTVNPDALPASGTAVDSSSSSANDGWSWVIDPACYTATPADAGLIAELAATANIVPNPRLAVDGTPPVLTSAAVIAAAEAPLADHGIERAYEVGTGGAAFFERIGIPFDALARVAHVSAYVWSATGTDWPSLVQLHRFAGGVSQGFVNLATVEQLSNNLRRLFATTTIPAGVEDNEFRLGVPGGGLVSGARAQIGGFQGLIVSRPVSAFRIPRDRWSDQYKGPHLAAALKRANPMIGKRIAIIGDSIVQNYGIPALIAERLGCEVINLGFGGARMAWDNRTSGTLYMYKKWFSATALADAVESGDWSNQIAAAEDLYNDPGRGSTDDFRAAALLMSTMDWTKIDAILVMMGTNDYGGGIVIGDDLDTDLTHFLPATKNVIAQFSAALPKTRLLFAPPMWRGPRAGHGDSNLNNNGTHWMYEYQDTIIDRAAYSQIPIVPVHKEVGINVDNTLALMTDDLHPGADGRTRIVESVSAGVRRLF